MSGQTTETIEREQFAEPPSPTFGAKVDSQAYLPDDELNSIEPS